MDEVRETTSPGWLRAEMPAAIFVIVFALFIPTLFADWMAYDDEMNFLRRPHYRGLAPENLKWMWTNREGLWIPLTWMSLGLDHLIWDTRQPDRKDWQRDVLKASGYHLTNNVLHALNATLFYLVLLALIGSTTRRAGWAAAAGALFFALHPLRVESVAWITERRDVLSGFFFLLTMLAYIGMARDSDVGRRRKLYVASLVCFALSMMSKAAAMALPVVLLILDIYPLRRFERGERLRRVLEKLPFLAITIAVAAMAVYAQLSVKATLSLERHSIFERFVQSSYGLSAYVGKTILPIYLSPIYLIKTRLTFALYWPYVAIAFALNAGFIALACWKRWYAPLVAWLSFGILVSPVLGFMQSGPHMAADRYTYIPCLSWAALFAAAVFALLRSEVAPRIRQATLVIAAVWIGALGLKSIQQTNVWHDSMAFWSEVIRQDPGNVVAYQGRGLVHLKNSDRTRAIQDFAKAIEINGNYGDSWNARGYVRMIEAQEAERDGKFDVAAEKYREALPDLDRAIQLMEAKDHEGNKSVEPYWYRAGTRAGLGDIRGAIQDWQRTLEIAPADWPSRGDIENKIRVGLSKLGER